LAPILTFVSVGVSERDGAEEEPSEQPGSCGNQDSRRPLDVKHRYHPDGGNDATVADEQIPDD
jgi:hypothetical protein